jgi:hypothetical protein
MAQHGRIGAAQHRIPATRDRDESCPPNGGPTDTVFSTIAECLENARQCELYAVRAADQEDRKFLLRKAKDRTKLARERELEIAASTRTPAA